MDILEQITIMKHETRLDNRGSAEGLKNWTDEARAKSLATRRARGSVWGWNHRPRATPSTGSGFDRSMEAMTEDAEEVRRALASQRSGVPTIGAPSKGAEQLAARRLDAFMRWLEEVKRVEGAIDDFNGVVAALGGLTSGVAKAQRGQSIGPEYGDPAAEAAARKAAVEKSIRRNFEKRNAEYLRQNPDERGIMLDMVAEKAEYYSAQPARKVEIEKDAYRRIRDSDMTLRETPEAKGGDYGTLLEAKRSFVRERDAVRPQLLPGEVAYPAGNGIWIGRLPNGDERVIDAFRDTARLYNRHTASCASSQAPSGECKCSCGGARHGQGGSQTKQERLAETKTLLKKRDEQGLKQDDMDRLEELLEGFIALYDRKPEPDSKNDMAEVERLNDAYFKEKEGEAPPASEASAQWENLVSGFRELIAKGKKPTLRNLRSQLLKDHDEQKFNLAKDALAEAYHTVTLDKFQEKFDRDPKNNFEFRTFQKKNGVPPEFIGDN